MLKVQSFGHVVSGSAGQFTLCLKALLDGKPYRGKPRRHQVVDGREKQIQLKNMVTETAGDAA